MKVSRKIVASDKTKIIQEFYHYCEKVENEWAHFPFNENASSEWNGKRYAHYVKGVVYGVLFERDPLIMECLNFEPDFDELLFLMQRLKTQVEEHAHSFLQNYPKNKREFIIASLEKPGLPELAKDNILEWVRYFHCCMLPENSGLSDQQLLMFLQLSEGYNYFKEINNDLFNYNQPAIEAIYKGLHDENYVRYGLIPVTHERVLNTNAVPCRIYDKKADKTIWLYVKPVVAKVLENLKTNNYINSYSFRGQNSHVYKGCNKTSFLFEDTEFGINFSFNIDKLCAVTKLYDGDFYNDQFWVLINHKNKAIQFEELDDEGRYGALVDADTVVTRLIHLFYDICDDGITYITHIDYEYLFYTQKEFEQRKTKPHTKGTKGKRIKIFKVDEARIPMNFPCPAVMISDGKDVKVPFIYFVVYMCFKHRILVNEYFDKRLKSLRMGNVCTL